MGTNSDSEACGRCSMTTAVDVAGAMDTTFDSERIEVDERELRQVSPHVIALGTLKDRLDEWATKFVYGR